MLGTVLGPSQWYLNSRHVASNFQLQKICVNLFLHNPVLLLRFFSLLVLYLIILFGSQQQSSPKIDFFCFQPHHYFYIKVCFELQRFMGIKLLLCREKRDVIYCRVCTDGCPAARWISTVIQRVYLHYT